MEVLKLFLSAVCVAACFSFVSCGVKSEKIVLDNGSYIEMVKIPDTDYSLCTTEIPQDFYQALTGENPSGSKGERLPVEKVSWFDAVVFCNKLSIVSGKTPVYSINGVTDPEAWGYVPHQHKAIEDKIEFNKHADGFRLPTNEEFEYCYAAGKDYFWSGSDDPQQVAWTNANSNLKSHDVATLKPNAYGLYDMSGNVNEWAWVDRDDLNRPYGGGSYFEGADVCHPSARHYNYGSSQLKTTGFRVACASESK